MTDLKFKINNSYNSPLNTNYDLLGLFKFEYIEMTDPIHKGEMTKVEYYSNFIPGNPNVLANYSNLILTEYRVYTRDPSTSLVVYKDQTVNWYLTDGSIGETKTLRKYYQFKDSIQEGIRRRDTITTEAKLYLLSTIGLVNGQQLIVDLSPQISIYLQGAHQPLLDAINASTEPFLTPTIKTTVISILTF
jgi:hypothetical protein